MVLLIAGPPVEVGVTMYVLSISSVSEVLMVQFAFSNSYRTHNELSRPFHLFYRYLLSHPPPPPSIFARACTVARLLPPPPPSPLFFVHHVALNRRSIDRSIDRPRNEIRSFSSAPLIPLCRLFPILFVSRLSNPRNERSTNIRIRWTREIRAKGRYEGDASRTL